MKRKVQGLRQLKKSILSLKSKGKRAAFTNGCFDILHYGHIKYLEKAKRLADILIVAVNSDASVRRLKGKGRPLNPLKQRMEILAALEAVDFVVSFADSTPYRVIKFLRPDVLVKGGDWKVSKIVGRDIVESYGGKVVNVAYIKAVSTTKLVKRIAKKF